MSPKILIPTPIRQFTGGRAEVELSAGSLRQGFEELFKRYPDLRRQLCSEDGSIRSFVNVYLNDEDIRYMAKEATPVKDGDVVSIVPSIAGGNYCVR